ncbi:Caspase-1 [Anabarilius grahami]|uniref:Caspase-1 n=1 Tax=Anabarilius grahami TaxID=495550 RepID=A0A3N0Z0A4_ANAGA|nr:Caspase-1 [Anabarilius grahami]
MTKDIEPIPRARLQTTVRHDVVDRMVQQYSANAGNIAVKVLQNMKQNDLAIDLEQKLKEAATVKNFAALPHHEDSDSTFVVIMSHGKRIENKDAIAGVNYHKDLNPDDYFFVDDIFTRLNSEKCPALIDKPKVILIQACRGENSGAVEIQSDAAVHIEKDFVSFKSTLPDIVAYRNSVNGSYFICYILEVFCDWAHSDEIKELFRKVTSCMENDTRLSISGKLMPCVDRMTLPKKLYLFPGL